MIDGADLFIGLSGARVMPPEALRAHEPTTRWCSRWPTRTPEVTPEEARALRPRDRHRPQRLPEPDQQRPLLPRHLPRRARRPRPRDHRGDEDGGRPRDRVDRAADDELREDYIIPSVFNRDVADAVAAAVADQAKAQGTAEAHGDEIGYAPRRDRGVPRRPALSAVLHAITITGASGLIGSQARRARCAQRGDEVTTLSRAPADAARRAPRARRPRRRRPPGRRERRPALDATRPASASASRASSGTRQLVAAIAQADAAPQALVCASAPSATTARAATSALDRGRRRRATTSSPQVCVAWEREAERGRDARPARGHGPHRRRARRRRRRAGEDAAPVQARRRRPGGRRASSTCRGSTSTTSSASTSPRSTTRDWQRPGQRHRARAGHQRRRSRKALGRALHRPAVAPIPGFAIRALYGDMAEIVTEGQRAVPRKALALGYPFQHPDLDEALRRRVG